MNLSELAQRIRAIRRERGLTLEEVASKSGLTRSWLSKVENFRVTPSLPALSQIAQVLGIPVAELVRGLDETPPLIVVRRGERKVVDRDQSEINTTVYEALAHKRSNRKMDPFLLTIPSGVAREEALGHEGEEFLIVQGGRVDFEYDDQLHHLEAGDSLYFDASVPHRLINPHDETAQVLCVFSSPKSLE